MDYISGGSGFLGKHLLKKLNKNTVSIPHKDLSFIKLEPFNNFYFLSSYGNMADQVDDTQIMQANIIDLIKIIDQARKLNFRSFVFVSTSSVKLRVQTMYSRSKKAAEEVLLSYMEKYSLPITIVRPYSITGVGEQPSHLIPRLIDSCLKGTPMNFVSHPTHDFIDVDDVAEGIMNLSLAHARGIFELGSGVSHTNKEVLEIVEKVTGKKANITPVFSLRPYDTDMWVSLNMRGRGYGWVPKITLEESIRNMVKAYGNS